jgi:hypothetical protein
MIRSSYTNNFQYSWVSVGVGGVSLAGSIFKGIKASNADKEAAREGAALKRPFFQIPTEDIENKNIAASLAQSGLSADEKLYAEEQRGRGLASSLQAQGDDASPNDSARIFGVFSDSLKSQSALDADLHRKNIEFFTRENAELAGKKMTQWGINELQPYESKLKEIQDRRIAAQTNENNAFNEAIGSGTAIATGVNSFMKTRGTGGSINNPSPSPYSRTFGLAKVGEGFNSPASGISMINPNAPNILNNVGGGDGNSGFPDFDQDTWSRMKQDAWDEGSNVWMWNHSTEEDQ